VKGAHTAGFSGFYFVAHVNLAGGIATDKNSGKAWNNTGFFDEIGKHSGIKVIKRTGNYLRRDAVVEMEKLVADGIRVDDYFYDYDNIRSFWIFYETEEEIRVLSLHSKKTFLPYIQIPIGNANPIKIRETLLQYLPEIKQELSVIDRLERMIGL